jgi:hypothetical protein
MPNPYHDSQGRFASRDELKGLVDQAYKDGDMSTYIRERANLEDIERDIELDRLAAQDSQDFTQAFGKVKSARKSRDMSDFEQSSDFVRRRGETMDWSIGERSPWGMSEADPYELADEDEKYRFPDRVLDTYVALSNSSSDYDARIDLRDALADRHYEYWPLGKNEDQGDPYRRYGDRPDEAKPHFEVSKIALISTRSTSTQMYNLTMDEYKSRLKHADNLKEEAEAIRSEIHASRESGIEEAKKAKFELAYIEDQYDITKGSDEAETTIRINEQMNNIQASCDRVVYSHAAERALDRFMESVPEED